jgi:hypothetical protein
LVHDVGALLPSPLHRRRRERADQMSRLEGEESPRASSCWNGRANSSLTISHLSEPERAQGIAFRLRQNVAGPKTIVEALRTIAQRMAKERSNDAATLTTATDTYVCASCRSDAEPARSAEVTARFAASKAAAAAARLRPPLAGLSPCTCTPTVTRAGSCHSSRRYT